MRSDRGRRLVEEAARLAKNPDAVERLEQARERLASGGVAASPAPAKHRARTPGARPG